MKVFRILLLAPVFVGACAFAPKYETLERQLQGGDYAAATATLEKSERAYGKSSRLLYYFDRLWAHHLAGDYARSNEFVEKANTLIGEIYTKSLTGEAL